MYEYSEWVSLTEIYNKVEKKTTNNKFNESTGKLISWRHRTVRKIGIQRFRHEVVFRDEQLRLKKYECYVWCVIL